MALVGGGAPRQLEFARFALGRLGWRLTGAVPSASLSDPRPASWGRAAPGHEILLLEPIGEDGPEAVEPAGDGGAVVVEVLGVPDDDETVAASRRVGAALEPFNRLVDLKRVAHRPAGAVELARPDELVVKNDDELAVRRHADVEF